MADPPATCKAYYEPLLRKSDRPRLVLGDARMCFRARVGRRFNGSFQVRFAPDRKGIKTNVLFFQARVG
jgi:hypothetical protein